MISSYTNEFDVTIEKYEDGARLVIPNNTYINVFCWIRLKDIPKVRHEKILYTLRNGRHEIIKKFVGSNTNCEMKFLELLLGKGNARGTLRPISESPLTFDVRALCDLIEKGKEVR